jgi:SAM-dependent methyltransferase
VDREDWNRRYSERGLVWSEEPNELLVEQVSALAPGRALDLAAGEGRSALWLAECGWRTTAVDYAESGLAKGRRVAEQRGLAIDWIVADLLEYDPGRACFDLVLLLFLQLPWDQMRGVLDRAARAVAPGGTFLLIGHDRSNLERGHGGPSSDKVLYTAEEIAGELGCLSLIEAGTRLRAVELEDRTVHAIDCLVRAVAGP